MKYMGSKRAMLLNGLGELLAQEVPRSIRFIDLFTGSGAVAVRVARAFPIQVLAFDLQRYSAILARAVIDRVDTFDSLQAWCRWHKRASGFLAPDCPAVSKITKVAVHELRCWSRDQTESPITNAYGGHYFSPEQASWLDALRKTLPRDEPTRTVALAALIQAASGCAAAPGHTAQPFQPTRTAKCFLGEAWRRDIPTRTKVAFSALALQCALVQGAASVGDANTVSKTLHEGDLVFIDPPYSGVHYSRFYHVLETIARGRCGDVSGVGRYPSASLRPRSKYSVGSESSQALSDLFRDVSSKGARAIVTFPAHKCSNGLSGDTVRELAAERFRIREELVKSRFSTLGGTGDLRGDEAGRAARRQADELVLVLEPK